MKETICNTANSSARLLQNLAACLARVHADVGKKQKKLQMDFQLRGWMLKENEMKNIAELERDFKRFVKRTNVMAEKKTVKI